MVQPSACTLQHVEPCPGLHREQVSSPDAGRVVAQKRAPRLTRRSPERLLTVAAHGASAHVEAKRTQLTNDADGAPPWILSGDAQDHLSPRERGNPASTASRAPICGSIPARAGEPPPPLPQPTLITVYPRASGGTTLVGQQLALEVGLSPRERGNHGRSDHNPIRYRSIPARAGEPRSRPRNGEGVRVYPRASGGTASAEASGSSWMGLSPRERGNRVTNVSGTLYVGSIPARAGEPAMGTAFPWRMWVYPRASGGTAAFDGWQRVDEGLSPRERGNPAGVYLPNVPNGSIPARAGEPSPTRTSRELSSVYPRASGGTTFTATLTVTHTGLSPRERGNRGSVHRIPLKLGSIPARAGEPGAVATWARIDEVYPRASGGTNQGSPTMAAMIGLSPRERGNQPVHPLPVGVQRSIPARAGEPPLPKRPAIPGWVYPRASGGTRSIGLRGCRC